MAGGFFVVVVFVFLFINFFFFFCNMFISVLFNYSIIGIEKCPSSGKFLFCTINKCILHSAHCFLVYFKSSKYDFRDVIGCLKKM